MKKALILTLIPLIFFANEPQQKKEKTHFEKCNIPTNIMSSIFLTEREIYREAGYPFLIRLNSKKDKEKIQTLFENEHYKKITPSRIDCYTYSNCTKLTNILIENEITNIDIGPYQINWYFHPDKKENIQQYFYIDTAHKKACNFVESLVKKYGWSWHTIARYHSGTKDKNESYQNKLKYHYEKLLIAQNKKREYDSTQQD